MITAPRFVAVPGFPGYAVSDHGDVISWKRGWFKFVSLVDAGKGYLRVGLSRNDKQELRLVHSLVLSVFDSERPDGMQVRHLNGNQQDNRIDNLKWGTAKENAEDRDRHGTTAHNGGEKCNLSKLNNEIVRQIRMASGTHREIAVRFGVSQPTVTRIIRGETWKNCGVAV